MSCIKRFFVEKKHGLDYEAKALLKDLKDNLQAGGLESLRILYRYDIEDVPDEHIDAAKNTVISEPPVDELYEDNFPLKDGETYFVTEYLKGQFDQCADSLSQCFQIISGAEKAEVSVAKVFVLKGRLTTEDIEKISVYCHNPVDSRIGEKEKPKSLKAAMSEPDDIKTVEGFIEKTDNELASLKEGWGFAMSLKDLIHCREYFKNQEGRNPTVTEIKAIDTYWSDHCRHTTFLTELKDVSIDPGYYYKPMKEAYNAYLKERGNIYKENRPITLMDMAVIGMKALKAKGLLEDLDESDEVNACSIEIPVDVGGVLEKWLLMFKNETHNHPTEIEPFGGAATCLGGAIRDPLSGRAYVYQAMRITGAGDPRASISETMEGKLPQRKITTEAAHGFSSYGNQIGLATGYVREIYDDGFIAKRMEIGAVIGAAPKENVIRETPAKGDLVIMVGGRTGRDGIGGATGSSKEHTVDSINVCGAQVQKGNPPEERKLQRLFRNKAAAKLIKRCNDFGAGGVCVAVGELADSLLIDLDKVLKKYTGLDGTELALSESQERMAVVVSPENAEKFIEYANEENLEAVVIAEVTDSGYLKMKWRGKEIVSIRRSFLNTNGAPQEAFARISSPDKFGLINNTKYYKGDVKQAFIDTLSDLNACSQKGLSEHFDSTIGAGTVLMPYGGRNQLTPEDVMAAKIPVPYMDTETASLMSSGYNPEIFKKSPFHGGVYAVVESVAKLVAAGVDYKRVRLSFQEYFEKMTEDPYTWGKPTAALLGAFTAQMGLGTPSIGGKDSMSGTFGALTVPPVLTSFGVGIENVNRINSAVLKAGCSLYIMTPSYDEYDIVDFDSLKDNFSWFYELSQNKIEAAAAVKAFGIAETVSKMAFGNNVGVNFNKEFLDNNGIDYLFKPLYGAIVFALPRGQTEKIDGNLVELLAETDTTGIITIGKTSISVEELAESWGAPLSKVFPAKTAQKTKIRQFSLYNNNSSGKNSSVSIAKPKVFIPVFPGTNCETDSKMAFVKAGAEVETFVVKNIKEGDIDYTVKNIAKGIESSNIIMLPGGFSAGDQPNGSAKYISAIFRNPFIKEAVQKHLNTKDGLILGICNGFQGLIKLGLLPWGEIGNITSQCPTLFFNEIGRHISQIVRVKVLSNNSPFLWKCKLGETYETAVSHGEGRFLASEQLLDNLAQKGQVATVYVDNKGEQTMCSPYNPNGSAGGVEGILSPNGRVFGKMGHSERISDNIYKNVDGNYDMKIFESAVLYFK